MEKANAEIRRRGTADQPFALREAEFRRKLLDQILGGPVYYPGYANTSFEQLRESWFAPQCAILKLLLSRLKTWRGLDIGNLEPFLEIGAFMGHLSGYLATTHGLRGYCGDVDRAVVERSLREVLPRLGMTARGLTPVEACAEGLPFEDGSLGLVFCFSTLHHFEDPVTCLEEIRRVLRPGGVFLCAKEPIQPRWRHGRKPTECAEVEAGLIENVYRVDQYDAMIRNVFPDFESMPYDDLRIPGAIPAGLRPAVSWLVNGRGRRWLRRFVYSRLGGQDYSTFGFAYRCLRN